MSNVANTEKLVRTVHELLDTMENLSKEHVADGPVDLHDADSFNVQLAHLISREDIKVNRRALADAISAEKWVEGAKFAFALLRIIGVFG